MTATKGVRAAVFAAVIGIGVSGCGPSSAARAVDPEPGTITTVAPAATPVVAPPPAKGIDYRDPTLVCRGLVAAMYSADTVRDTGPGDAWARATAFTDAALARQIGAANRDGRWDTWRAHRVRLDAHLAGHGDEHQPPDSTTEAFRAQQVTVTPVGSDGWRGWTERTIVYCTLRASAGGWRVTGYDMQPVVP